MTTLFLKTLIVWSLGVLIGFIPWTYVYINKDGILFGCDLNKKSLKSILIGLPYWFVIFPLKLYSMIKSKKIKKKKQEEYKKSFEYILANAQERIRNMFTYETNNIRTMFNECASRYDYIKKSKYYELIAQSERNFSKICSLILSLPKGDLRKLQDKITDYLVECNRLLKKIEEEVAYREKNYLYEVEKMIDDIKKDIDKDVIVKVGDDNGQENG